MREITASEAFDLFRPDAVIFVISQDENSRVSGMVACWHMKCSKDPALYAVALSKSGYTHKLIQQSKEFVVAVPDKTLEKEVLFFGGNHGNEVDKFKETGLETEKAKFVKPPLISKAAFNFECALEKEIDSGDHIIFIGKILAVHLNDGKKVLANMKKVDGKRVFEEF